MNVHPRSSVNGLYPRRSDGEIASRADPKSQMSKSSHGLLNGGNIPGYESLSRDRLIFVTTCLIGHSVEVHVRNGSVLSGIFHTINAEKDCGIVLKMARETKGSSSRVPKSSSEIVKRPQTIIIPARELVQVIAKDILLTNDGIQSGSHDKRHDLMTDSVISQSRRVDVERELERWIPDEDDPQRPELENIFDRQWNRKWDQFEANESLFGVKTTFNEELYTTKLERGPQMRDIEREAIRIAREIEGEDTKDLHLAEERGFSLGKDFDSDEEARFSSVQRGTGPEITRVHDDVSSSSRDEEGSPSIAESRPPATDSHPTTSNVDPNHSDVVQETDSLKSNDGHSPLDTQKLSAAATAFSPSSTLTTKDSRVSLSNLRPGSSASSTSEKSLETPTAEKSTLNPHAKEFKLNPNAKSFVPTVRPPALGSETNLYYHHNPAISQMHGIPLGVGPAFPQQAVYNPQGIQMQAPQGYVGHAGSPYGQQMIMGQPRPVIFMPGYPHDMTYKGREF